MQQEYSNAENNATDISKYIDNGIRCVKNYWIQMALMSIIVVLGTISYYNFMYKPMYTAKVTYAVKKTEYASVDSSIAKRLSTAIAQLCELKEFRNELFENIKEETYNTNYTIDSVCTLDTTLYTVNISANHYANANILLDRFQEIYPDWASGSVGTVDLQVVGTTYCAPIPMGGYPLKSALLKGLIIAFVMCVGIIYIYSQFVSTVQKEGDMRKIGVKNCITVVPEVIQKKRRNGNKTPLLIFKNKVDWGFKQSILAAESRIDNQLEEEGKKVIVITSTVPQEGKSSISVNLALAMANKGKKILLIDGDFRKPSVCKTLGIEEQKGITDCFIDMIHPSKLIRRRGTLDLLSAGSYAGAVSGILNHKIMNVLMKKWRQEYDYILIDTAPSLYTDASIFAQYADGVLYVVRYDMCNLKDIKQSISSYVRNNQLIGYILNRNPGGFSTYGKYGRYGRYGSYGKYGRYGKYYGHYGSYVSADIEAKNREMAEKQRHERRASSMNTEDSL